MILDFRIVALPAFGEVSSPEGNKMEGTATYGANGRLIMLNRTMRIIEIGLHDVYQHRKGGIMCVHSISGPVALATTEHRRLSVLGTHTATEHRDGAST